MMRVQTRRQRHVLSKGGKLKPKQSLTLEHIRGQSKEVEFEEVIDVEDLELEEARTR